MTYVNHIPDPMAAHVAAHPVFGPVVLNVTRAPPASLESPMALVPRAAPTATALAPAPIPRSTGQDLRTQALRAAHQDTSATHPFLNPHQTHTPSDTPRVSPAWRAQASPYPYPIRVIPSPCWRLLMRGPGAEAVGLPEHPYAAPRSPHHASRYNAWQEHPSPLFQRLQYGYLHRTVTMRLRWPTHLPDGTEYWRIERYIPDQLQSPHSTVTLTAKQPRHHPQPKLPHAPPDLIYPG